MKKSNLHALVVDDNFYNRDLCILALSHLGIPYVEAENGKVALTLLEQQSFNLLLLDLAMPEVDGRTVIKNITEIGIRNELYIIIITAHSYLAKEVEELADLVLHKPIDIFQFTLSLQQLAIN